MPLIRVSMFPGRAPDQKAELVRRLTEAYLEVCGLPGQSTRGVWVVIDEVPAAHWGVGGEIHAG
jgi:4-oxalocrotonate tautomerase